MKRITVGLVLIGIFSVVLFSSCSNTPTGQVVFSGLGTFEKVQDIEDALTLLYEKAIVLNENKADSTDDYTVYDGGDFTVYELKKPLDFRTFARQRAAESNNYILSTEQSKDYVFQYKGDMQDFTWGVQSTFLMLFYTPDNVVKTGIENNRLMLKCGNKFVISVKQDALDNEGYVWLGRNKDVVFSDFPDQFDTAKATAMPNLRRLQMKCNP